MNLKYFHVVELLQHSFVAMGYSGYHGNQVDQQYILSQGTYLPNIDLRSSHKAELLHSLLVVMVTVFPWQQSHLLQRTFVPNMKLNYFIFLFIAQFPGCHGNNVSIPAR